MRPIISSVTGLTASATSIAAATTLGAAGSIPLGGSLATANGVANAQTLAGAGQLILNGTLAFNRAVAFPNPSRLNLTSTGNLSGVNFTVVGLVAQGPDTTGNTGGPQTEVIVGPNNSVVVSQNTWLRILSITASAAVGTNVSAFGTPTMGNAGQVSLTSANDQSAVNFTIYGFNANGQPTTEVVVGPGAGLTVNSVNYWSAVTQITASAATNAVSAGNSASAATPWVVVDYLPPPFNVGISDEITVGAVNYSVQVTNDDVFGGIPYATPAPVAFFTPIMALVGANISQMGWLTTPCRAVRTITNTGTGTVAMHVTQGLKT